jgi:hypothetical protein
MILILIQISFHFIKRDSLIVIKIILLYIIKIFSILLIYKNTKKIHHILFIKKST